MSKQMVLAGATLLGLLLIILPVQPSAIPANKTGEPAITIDIKNNIAILRGKVASAQQALEAEKLIFTLTGIDWVENKITVDPALSPVTSGLISGELIRLLDPG